MEEITMLEISGTLKGNLSVENYEKIFGIIEELALIEKRYNKAEPILARLEAQIDDTEGMLNLYKNRIEAEEDPMKKMMLLEKTARFATRMFMLKRIQNGSNATPDTKNKD